MSDPLPPPAVDASPGPAFDADEDEDDDAVTLEQLFSPIDHSGKRRARGG